MINKRYLQSRKGTKDDMFWASLVFYLIPLMLFLINPIQPRGGGANLQSIGANSDNFCIFLNVY